MDLQQYHPHALLDWFRAWLDHVIYLRIQRSLAKLELR